MRDVYATQDELAGRGVEIARAAIASVTADHESVELEPMSAFERKVVHDEVLAAGLVSDSSGTEPRRFVVVHPAAEAAVPAAEKAPVETDEVAESTTVSDEDVAAG